MKIYYHFLKDDAKTHNKIQLITELHWPSLVIFQTHNYLNMILNYFVKCVKRWICKRQNITEGETNIYLNETKSRNVKCGVRWTANSEKKVRVIHNDHNWKRASCRFFPFLSSSLELLIFRVLRMKILTFIWRPKKRLVNCFIMYPEKKNMHTLGWLIKNC